MPFTFTTNDLNYNIPSVVHGQADKGGEPCLWAITFWNEAGLNITIDDLADAIVAVFEGSDATHFTAFKDTVTTEDIAPV